MSRDISKACSILQAAWPRIYDAYSHRYPGVELRIVQVDRSDAEQIADYAKGRTQPGPRVTDRDGIRKLSMHQIQARHGEIAAHAIDLGVFIGAIYVQRLAPYLGLVTLAMAYGLRSGADWNHDGETHDEHGLVDAPHLECLGLLPELPGRPTTATPVQA